MQSLIFILVAIAAICLVAYWVFKLVRRAAIGRSFPAAVANTWIVLLVAAHVPFVQFFLAPLLFYLPIFEQTNQHIEYTFLWFGYKSVLAYLAVATYCILISLILVTLVRKLEEQKEWRNRPDKFGS